MVVLKLEPDYCCGGGHCGPLPGYFYDCPLCEKDTNCKTYYPLKEGGMLKCNFCNGEIKATKKLSEFEYEFEMVEDDVI